MNDLIQINKSMINGAEVNSVNARETYDYLGLARGQFSRWIKSAIEKYDFIENEDYITIDTDVEGTKDYIITLDMAKELCMISNTEKGKEARKYFIEVEKKKNITALPSAKELALMVVKAEEEKEKLQIENQKKSQFISNVVHSNNSYTATQVAKDLNISAKLFNKMLIEANVIFKQNGTYILTSRYQNFGLTEIKESQPDKNGNTFINLRWTVKGKNWLKNNWDRVVQRVSKDTFDEYNMSIIKSLPIVPMPHKANRNY